MAVVPDPNKLFLPDPDYVPPFWNGKFFPGFMAVLGIAGTAVSNNAARRPMFSGIQKHIGAAIALGGLGMVLQKWYDDRNMEKDAIYRHYISLHPEDFPMPERKKVGEIFPTWTPVR